MSAESGKLANKTDGGTLPYPASMMFSAFIKIRCGDGYRVGERTRAGEFLSKFSFVSAEPKITIRKGTMTSHAKPLLSLL